MQDAMKMIVDAIYDLQSRSEKYGFSADLVVGTNRLSHGLGHGVHGATLTPTVADATFAWELTSSDDKQVVITVVGVDQPKAWVEVW